MIHAAPAGVNSACSASCKAIVRRSCQGEYVSFPANASHFDSAECKTALETLANLEDVICSRGPVDSGGGATYEIGETVREWDPEVFETGVLVGRRSGRAAPMC